MFTILLKNNMLACLDASAISPVGGQLMELSLHTSYPGVSGVGEVTGGAYARMTNPANFTWATAANAQRSLAASVTFDVPGGGTTVQFWGGWGQGGTDFRAFGAIGNGTLVYKPQADTANNRFFIGGHGFTNDDRVTWLGSGSAPTGFTPGGEYYIVASAVDSVQLAATVGGGAIAVSDQGDKDMFLSRIRPETFDNDGKLTLTTLDLIGY